MGKNLHAIENLLLPVKVCYKDGIYGRKVTFYKKFTLYKRLYYKDVTYGEKVTFYKERKDATYIL